MRNKKIRRCYERKRKKKEKMEVTRSKPPTLQKHMRAGARKKWSPTKRKETEARKSVAPNEWSSRKGWGQASARVN